MTKFVVNKEEFITKKESSAYSNALDLKVNSDTSVEILKNDFFRSLSEFGEILLIDKNIEKNVLVNQFANDDIIYVCFNTEPVFEINCRLLNHSLGSLLLTGGFLNKWTIAKNTINIVTSHTQKNQLKKSLGKSCFNLGVFTPKIENEIFYFNRGKKDKIRSKLFRIQYAGRIIANKGIIQTIRALNLWPLKNAEFVVIGDFEPDCFIYHSQSYNTTFPNYFIKEGIYKNRHLSIKMKSSINRNELRNEYFQSDCFIYPSFHEDENFGLAPREAILSGLPAVVSDFCGLGNIGNTKGCFAIKTYASLAGIRYSIKQLANSIHLINNRSPEQAKEFAHSDSEFIKNECNRENALNNLNNAIQELKMMPVSYDFVGGWRSIDRVKHWSDSNNYLFKKAVELKDESLIEGLYVDGTGLHAEGRWFSDAHFMQAIQSVYTTLPSPPLVEKNKTYRGFWRISLWDREYAVVEFGFPGPRIIRFTKQEFQYLKNCYQQIDNDDCLFIPKKEEEIILIQNLINLGYLVPDEL